MHPVRRPWSLPRQASHPAGPWSGEHTMSLGDKKATQERDRVKPACTLLSPRARQISSRPNERMLQRPPPPAGDRTCCPRLLQPSPSLPPG